MAVVAALTCLCTPHQPAWASPNHGAAQTTQVKRKPPAAHTAAQRGKPSPTKPAKPHGRRPPGAAEPSAATASHRAELKDLHGRIESLQRDLSRTQASQSSVSDELRDTETAISSTNRRLRELAERQDALSNDVQQLEVQTTRLGSQIATQQKQLQALLYRRFLHGENDALQLLLSGEDPARIAQDQYFLARLSEAKARLLAQLRDSRAEKQRLADVRRDKVAELESVEKDQQKNHAALLQKQKERQAVWVRIGDQINQQFRLALGREELDRPQVGELLVDLKRRIQRDFSIVAQDDERIVLSNKAGAQAAPSMLAAAPDEVELLVTDHNMPGMTGLALAAEVRRLHPGLPVILTSGYLSGDLHRGAVALDDVKLLNKEDSFDKLSALIDAMLGGR